LEKGVFLASSVNRFLEDILSSSNQKPQTIGKGLQRLGSPTLLLWRSLKQPQGKAARINHKFWMFDVFDESTMNLETHMFQHESSHDQLSLHAMTKQ